MIAFPVRAMLLLALVRISGAFDVVEPEYLHVGLESGMGNIYGVDALVDVRTPEEWKNGHIEGAYFVDSLHKTMNISALKGCEECRVVAYCHMGPRAKMAAKLLEDNGFKNVGEAYDKQWTEQGYALVNTPSKKPTCAGTGICYPVKFAGVKMPPASEHEPTASSWPDHGTLYALGALLIVVGVRVARFHGHL